jgi:hypothetical protein
MMGYSHRKGILYMHTDFIRYLATAGVHYKPAESPDLWAHVEECFADHGQIGPRFNPIPHSSIAELIAKGEDGMLAAMVAHHQQTGRLDVVQHVLDLPYIIGTEGKMPLKDADAARLLRLVNRPGTAQEHLISVLAVEADAIPCTNRMTITGGLYADGHTAGLYGVHPGNVVEDAFATDAYALLATAEDILALSHEMEMHMDDIACATRKECDAMLKRVKKLLG